MADEPAIANQPTGALNMLRWVLCLLGIALVVIAVLLPPQVLSWLRSDYWRFFGQPLNWLDMASSRIDLTHVVLFAGIGFLLSCLWPRAPWWRVGWPLLALAAGSEAVQFWVPGRSPLASDLYDDLIGIAVGLALAIPVRWIARRREG